VPGIRRKPAERTERRSFGYPYAVGSFRYKVFVNYNHRDGARADTTDRIAAVKPCR
jgi:hypothetical protein